MSAAAAPITGAHLLVAEDDPSAARVLRVLLEQAGHRVTLASTGEEARRILEEEGAPDLLLLDWMLPGISGLELCHFARERWDPLRLPILMVTARTDPESMYAAFDAGASDYVGKPFRGPEIRARIAAHLRTARLHLEHERLDEHLREREKLFTLGLLAGSVAHDLNSPLSVIGAHAQLLLRGDHDPPVAQAAREILAASERCSRIVADLLGFARRRPVERVPLDLAAVLRSTVELRERRLSAAGIELTLDLQEPLPQVEGDPHQLQQLFLNVLLNAEHALAQSGRHIRVSARAAGGAVEAELWNDGPPIPPEALPHVFEPLFTTKPGEEGTGLGLFIGRRIAAEHGGSMDVRSDEGGTCFRVRIPAGGASLPPTHPVASL
jgi:signal transduction histidine kinase